MSLEPPQIVILVDDDPAVLHALQVCFEAYGFEARAYPDAESLLHAADYPKRGCLVVDYRLPGRDGLELLATLRQDGVALPAVLISTPTSQLVSEAARSGVPLIEKPLMSGKLVDTVRTLIAGQP